MLIPPSSLRRSLAPFLLVLSAGPVAAGEITSITNTVTGAAVVPNLSSLDVGVAYEVAFQQSVGDPLLRGLYLALPPGLVGFTITDHLGGGDIQVNATALGGTWSVSGDGEHVNIVDSGSGVTGGAIQILFDRVPGGTSLEWAHAIFSDDGQLMPGANTVATTPGDDLRLPALTTKRGFNRIQLDNEGDVLVHLSNPSIGSDPTMGDFSGDLYTKVFPREVFLHPKGTLSVTAIEYSLFDQDWDQDDATLWSWGLTVGVESSDVGGGGSGTNPGNIEPLFTDPSAVFVSEVPAIGLGNPLGFGVCPSLGQIAGYTIEESFLDTAGQPVPILTLVADGTVDYVFTHFAPDGHDSFNGGVSCGSGNASLSYLLSTDFNDFPFAVFEGENAPDTLGLGYSPLGAQRGGGELDFSPLGLDETAAVRLMMDEPTLVPLVDAGLDGGLLEHGLAGLNLPIGVDSGGIPTGTMATLGWRIYNDDAAPTMPGPNATRAATVFATLGVPLPSPGVSVNGACLLLNPADPIFVDSSAGWGLSFFQGVDKDGDSDVDETYYQSVQITVSPAIALINVPLYVQGIDIETTTFDAQNTQVVKVYFRAND